MTKHAPDRWLSAWDEYGESIDTNRIVQITVGILAPKTDPVVAISIAGETPVTLTHQATARLRESLAWAVEEQTMLLKTGARSDTADADTAVLDRAQWESIVAAVQSGPGAQPRGHEGLEGERPTRLASRYRAQMTSAAQADDTRPQRDGSATDSYTYAEPPKATRVTGPGRPVTPVTTTNYPCSPPLSPRHTNCDGGTGA